VKRLRKLWVDGGSRAEWLHAWVGGVKQTHKIDLEVVERAGKGLHVLPRRWVIERTFAWLLNYRRHSRDYEVLTANSEAMIQISMVHLLRKRLA
jgi:putative transposase